MVNFSVLQKNKNYTYVIFGIIFGLLSFFSPGSLFIFFLILIAVFFINRLSDKSERKFILSIFLTAIGARIILVVLTMYFAIFMGKIFNYASYSFPDYSAPYIINDSGFYTLRAQFMSMHWLGQPMDKEAIIFSYMPYGYTGFIYALATFFTLFGYSPISSTFINCFLGSLTAILVYAILKNITNEKAARLAAILTAFFPSLFIWSITNLKETSTAFMICLMLWALVKFQKTRKFSYLVITALSILIQGYIRHNWRTEFIIATLAMVLFYIFYIFIFNFSLRKQFLIFFIVFMISAVLIFSYRDTIKSKSYNIRHRIYIAHGGAVSEGGICYKILPDAYYDTNSVMKNVTYPDFLKMLGKGWLHIILEPLPWNIQTWPILFSFFQMIIWYPLICFAIIGIFILARYRLKESIFLITYFFIMTSALAVIGGNIGTIFRLRDINTPILMIFASVGLIKIFSYIKLEIVK